LLGSDSSYFDDLDDDGDMTDSDFSDSDASSDLDQDEPVCASWLQCTPTMVVDPRARVCGGGGGG
jgi:hypothetical protein